MGGRPEPGVRLGRKNGPGIRGRQSMRVAVDQNDTVAVFEQVDVPASHTV